MPGDIEQVTAQLTKLVRAKTGDAGARAHSLESLPGHAGFSYSFILERSDPGAKPAGKYVVRIAPPGVKISGPADIVRQARVMASLADTPVAVPPIIWYGDEPEFFERPYFVGGFVEGFKLGESPAAARAFETARAQWDRDDGGAAQRRVGAAPRGVGRAVRAQRGAQAPRLPARPRRRSIPPSSRAHPNFASDCARACRQARASDASMATSNGRTCCSTRNASSR